jgi:hypothetical protein
MKKTKNTWKTSASGVTAGSSSCAQAVRFEPPSHQASIASLKAFGTPKASKYCQFQIP